VVSFASAAAVCAVTRSSPSFPPLPPSLPPSVPSRSCAWGPRGRAAKTPSPDQRKGGREGGREGCVSRDGCGCMHSFNPLPLPLPPGSPSWEEEGRRDGGTCQSKSEMGVHAYIYWFLSSSPSLPPSLPPHLLEHGLVYPLQRHLEVVLDLRHCQMGREGGGEERDR